MLRRSGNLAILDLSTGEKDFPQLRVKYHMNCGKEFVNQKAVQTLLKETKETVSDHVKRTSSRQAKGSSSSALLPETCIFCTETKTRENLCSIQEFRGNNTVRKSAAMHLKKHTNMSSITAEFSGICSKDLMSSETKYHSSCYKAFVRVLYENGDSTTENPSGTTADDPMEEVYQAVCSFCDNLMANPRIRPESN